MNESVTVFVASAVPVVETLSGTLAVVVAAAAVAVVVEAVVEANRALS